jgi:NAD(P)H-dependent FMN reductase
MSGMTLTSIAGVPRHDGAKTVALVPLSPRVGTCYSQCSRLARELTTAGVVPAFLPTHELPVVPAGMDNVPGFSYPRGLIHLIDTVVSADAVILGAPVQKNAVSGWARNLVEIIRVGLAEKPVLPIVAAGSVRAHLAGNAFRSDLHGNFDAVASPAVVVSPDVSVDEIRTRINASVTELLARIGVESELAERVS